MYGALHNRISCTWCFCTWHVSYTYFCILATDHWQNQYLDLEDISKVKSVLSGTGHTLNDFSIVKLEKIHEHTEWAVQLLTAASESLSLNKAFSN